MRIDEGGGAHVAEGHDDARGLGHRWWCAWQPQTGVRRLDENEVAALTEDLRRALTRARHLWAGRVVSTIAGLGLSGLFIAGTVGDAWGITWPATLMAALVPLCAAYGATFALVYVLFGAHRLARAAFALAGALAVVAVVVPLPEDFAAALALGSGAYGIVGGLVAAFVTYRSGRALQSVHAPIMADLLAGEVWVFGEAPSALELFPSAHVVHRVDGERVVDLRIEHPVSLPAIETFVTQKRPHEREIDRRDELALYERPLREVEAAEVATLRRRLARRLFVLPVVVTWSVACVARGVALMASGHVGADLAPIGWVIALGCGAFAAAPLVRMRTRLAQDLDEGKACYVKHVETGAVLEEHLARSGLVLSSEGHPAPGRMRGRPSR